LPSKSTGESSSVPFLKKLKIPMVG
jgi:hypothetical protein